MIFPFNNNGNNIYTTLTFNVIHSTIIVYTLTIYIQLVLYPFVEWELSKNNKLFSVVHKNIFIKYKLIV